MQYKERYFDPIHGFIHVSEEEKRLLDHPAFMRLHYLHQLGLAYLVYPGATHSRFEHSLGVMHIATRIYDQLFDTPDPFLRQALRIGALCHDLGHLPFSHTLEHDPLKDYGHELKTLDIIEWLDLEGAFHALSTSHKEFVTLVKKIALSPQVYLQRYPDDDYSEDQMLLSLIVSGDYFGADRIDYLIRDSRFTGVSVGLFDFPQLIEMLQITQVDARPKIVLKEEGLHAAEGLLLARHYMHLRVYRHPACIAFNETLNEFIKKVNHLDFCQMAPQEYIRYTDAWLTDQFIKASFDPKSLGHAEALILMKKSKKMKPKQIPSGRKPPGPLCVLKKDGTIETLYPVSMETAFFSRRG